ncbi:hypothetical protein KRX57_08690 [Weeksellaceae bacterium TAE3-ERU29]|nr:hypothetical protein [Weeksellaceae bacterium TAE3-ERU29]
MKNLFLTLAFILLSSLTFANSSEPVYPPFYGEIIITEASSDSELTEFTVQFADLKSFQEFDVSQLPISNLDKCKLSIKVDFQIEGTLTMKKSIKYDNMSCNNMKQDFQKVKESIKKMIK